MPRVLLSGKLHDDGMAVLRARPDVTVVQMTGEDPAEFVAKLPDADALLIRTALLPREALVNAGRLKVVSRHGVGYDNVPVDALDGEGRAPRRGRRHSLRHRCRARHVPDAGARQGRAPPRPRRRAPASGMRRGRSSRRSNSPGGHCSSSDFGRIGRALPARARAFEMKVIAVRSQRS